MSKKIVLDGEVSLKLTLDGDVSLKQTMDGEPGLFKPIPPVLEESKTISPTEQTQIVTPDPQYNGMRKVTVEAIPDNYVGSAIVHDPEITVNGASVNVPSGYHTEDKITTVQTAVQGTPSITVNGTNITATSTQLEGYVAAGTKMVTATVPSGSVIVNDKAITANPTISVGNDGKITASVSASSSVSPTVSEGYVTGGTSGTVTVSGQNTTQMTTQPGATITPTESQQTAVAAGKYTTGAVKVGAIPSNYVGSGIVHDPTPTVSGATVNIPTGYYSQNSSKSVQTAQQATPVITVNGGNITATATQSEGYVQSGTKTATATIPTVQQAIPVMSVSGATVTATATQSAGLVNAGTETASATVQSGSVSVDNQNITVNPTINVDSNGEITASVSGSETLTARVSEGYVDTSTPGTAAISGTATSQLSTMAGQTVTPTTSVQTLNTTGKYMIGNVVVNAMPTGTAGTPTATKGAVVNNSVTITPSVINSAGYIPGGTITGTGVSVSASELVSGTQTITNNGTVNVTNLEEVVVALAFSNVYTESSAPSPSLGVDGDIYLQV